MITRALPDDTSLQSFQLAAPEGPGKPPKVLLVGQTGNAAALMQQLGAQPGLKDVKAPSAAVKPLGKRAAFCTAITLDAARIFGSQALNRVPPRIAVLQAAILVILLAVPVVAGVFVWNKHRWAQEQLAQLEPRFARLSGLQKGKDSLAQAEASAKALL
eukprot:gene49595-67338_t